MIVYHCSGCGATTNQPLGKATQRDRTPRFGYARVTLNSDQCPHCKSPVTVAGPMWADKLHNEEFINEILSIHSTVDENIYGTLPRIKGMLTLAKSELPDTPFYINVQKLASKLRASSPPHKKIISAICNAGFNVSYTHAQPGALKTDAPASVLLDILKAWVIHDQDGKVSSNLKPNSPGFEIMKNPKPS